MPNEHETPLELFSGPNVSETGIPNDPADDSIPDDGKYTRQEFFLPISGFVWLYPEEVEVVDHPAFQRLSRINQLGQSYLVFRGATQNDSSTPSALYRLSSG